MGRSCLREGEPGAEHSGGCHRVWPSAAGGGEPNNDLISGIKNRESRRVLGQWDPIKQEICSKQDD